MTPEELEEANRMVSESLGGIKFIPFPGTQTRAYFSEAKVMLYGGKPGGGKLLRVDEKIPVPLSTDQSGYKNHGDLVVGDEVYSPDGTAVKVLARHPTCYNPDSYKVIFNTGEEIECDADHMWHTWTELDRARSRRSSEKWRKKRKENRPSRAVENSKKPWVSKSISKINSEREHDIKKPEPSAKSTIDILGTLMKGPARNHSVDVISNPIVSEHAALPISPYLLGLWLGDGSKNKGEVSMSKDDFYALDAYPFPKHSERIDTKNRKSPFCVRNFYGLKVKLRELGILGEKSIPPIYLRASEKQRKELLRGLMDTDGTVDKRGYCELGFSNEKLSYDALDLINGLGIKCAIRKKELSKKNPNHADHYRLKFIADFPVFKLKRKLERQKSVVRDTANRRYIVDVVKCDPVPMNCITVEGGLYCVGRTFITTHNSALIAGLALQEHHRSLLIRRNHSDLRPLIDVAKELNGSPKGFVGGGRPEYKKENGGVIHFMGLGQDGGLGSMQGEAHDFIGVDEVAQISEDPVRTVMGWLRPTTGTPQGQRLRVVMGSNPPLDSIGDWLIPFFPCWLDETYPNPAKDGELRWFIRDGGMDVECKEGDSVMLDGEEVFAHSRTFIASDYNDNPYINAAEYLEGLSSMNEEQRRILMSGNFLLSRSDAERQLIPTAWIRAAQARWSSDGHKGKLMESIGADVSGSGSDMVAIYPLYESLYFGEPTSKVGSSYSGPSEIAADIVLMRRGGCPVGVDMGGGYGGGPKEQLNFADISAYGFIPNKATQERTADKSYGFVNLRALAYWRLREALDPSQDGGSVVALPPSKKLLSDLATPRFFVKMHSGRMCIQVESKDDIKKRIRRSPDEGDAIVIALWTYMYHTKKQKFGGNAVLLNGGSGQLKAKVGYENRKRRR